ncbi:uncharacterized protein LOC130820358 [Amaranthus tricolor]|uniref:uncharacterized protein LOC130820358 n=1 Tax=Amaranthus tricolor TaxID=29722 RepID=UPI00258524C8|nr:uncharacterized protein LOC130820358 [Amaranthus tricolor]
MACLEMYNNTQSPSSPSPPPMSPRISFSNDFVESHNSQHNFPSSRSELPPASTDFEFSGVSSFNSVSSADELFFKGRLLPFKDTNNGSNTQMQRTLRDELLVNDDEPDFSLKPPRSSSTSASNKWRGFLGLRKSNIASKKVEKIEPCFDSGKSFSFSLEDPNLAKSPQELMSSEGQSSNDMEMGI